DPEPAGAAPGPAAPALVTAVWSPRRVPSLFVTAAAAVALRRALPSIVGPYSGCVTVDDADGPVARIADGEPLAGGSTQKLPVGASALALMGPGYRFVTRAMTDATVHNGVLAGDLTIVGAGDPLLTTVDTARTRQTPVTHLDHLADEIVAAGVHRIDG